MTNPSVLQQLDQERRREILEASVTPRSGDSPVTKARERLGWSLIGLGAHLARPRPRPSSWSPLTRA